MAEDPEHSPAVGGRAAKRAAVSRRLMETGLAIIAERGLDGAKVADITRAAGVAKGTFFTHFPSKDDFVVRLVDAVLSDLARRVKPLGLTPDDAHTLLAGVGAAHMRYFQLNPGAAALLTEACRLGGEAGIVILGRMGRHLDLVAGMLAPAREHLGWPEDRLRELALLVLSVSCGFFWFGGALGLGGDMPLALLERLGSMMARGLRAPA